MVREENKEERVLISAEMPEDEETQEEEVVVVSLTAVASLTEVVEETIAEATEAEDLIEATEVETFNRDEVEIPMATMVQAIENNES